MLYLIDVSHHQKPASLDWEGMRAAGCDGCIVRLTYGTMIDKQAPEHIRQARQAGMRVGAYLFFRPTQPVEEQLAAFNKAALLADYGRKEDIVPALDIEDDTESRPVKPEHAPLFEQAIGKLRIAFDSTPLAYITQRDWGRLGKPAWVLEYPLWVAHYSAPSRKEPATPNGHAWTIWQHRVGKFVADGPAGYYKDEAPQLDQNRANFLPLINGEEHRATIATPDEHADERNVEDDGDTHGVMAAVLADIIAPPLDPQSLPVLRLHTKGDHVRFLQERLALASKAQRIVADGSFGPLTEKFVRDFQRQRGLTADGVVGPSTWARLLEGTVDEAANTRALNLLGVRTLEALDLGMPSDHDTVDSNEETDPDNGPGNA